MPIGMKDDKAGRTIRMRMGNGNVSKTGIGKKPDAKTGSLKSILLIGMEQDGKIGAVRPQLSKIARRGNKDTEGDVKEIKRGIKAANDSRFDPVSGAEKGMQRAKTKSGYF